MIKINLFEIDNVPVYPDIPLTPEVKPLLKKNKKSVMHRQMKEDLIRFRDNIPSYKDEEGIKRSKCEISSFSIPIKPKSFYSPSKKKYEEYIHAYLKPKAQQLAKFKDLEILVYICVYLSKRKDRYPVIDVDNIAKPILDAMKPYFGDDKETSNGDRKVKVLIVEKKMLDATYPEDDLDYLENSVVVITDAMVRNDIVKI